MLATANKKINSLGKTRVREGNKAGTPGIPKGAHRIVL